ncbi:MAG: hypothetical protein AABZ47_07585, partial [Planctomycetota bacterium]
MNEVCFVQKLSYVLIVCASLAHLSSANATVTIYVKQNATGANTGVDWDNAFTNLDTALSSITVPNEVDYEVWVAAGTYTPANLATGFVLKHDLAIYGGFVGTELSRSQRNWETNLTVLSGDVGNDDTATCMSDTQCTPGTYGYCLDERCIGVNNSAHVVYVDESAEDDYSATLDGFTITRGNAQQEIIPGTFDEDGGGGVVFVGGSATFRNCVIKENRASDGGGGMYSFSTMKARLSNVTIMDNVANHGGGIGAKNIGIVEITNSRIINNRAAGDGFEGYGGGAELEGVSGSVVTMVNTLIAKNVASGSFGGGGLYMLNSGLTVNLKNCTVVDNRADHLNASGGGLFSPSSSLVNIDNSIIWGNEASTGKQIWTSQGPSRVTVQYSNVRRIASEGNIFGSVDFTGPNVFGDNVNPLDPENHDPHFADAGNGDYTLTSIPISVGKNVCIDAGSHELIPADVLDVDGNGDTSEPVPLDLLRNARQLEDRSTIDTGTTVSGCRVADMGAHEFTRPLCSKAHIVSSVPADWTIDARQPHPLYDSSLPARQGIRSAAEPIVITLDVSGSSSLQCWELC